MNFLKVLLLHARVATLLSKWAGRLNHHRGVAIIYAKTHLRTHFNKTYGILVVA